MVLGRTSRKPQPGNFAPVTNLTCANGAVDLGQRVSPRGIRRGVEGRWRPAVLRLHAEGPHLRASTGGQERALGFWLGNVLFLPSLVKLIVSFAHHG